MLLAQFPLLLLLYLLLKGLFLELKEDVLTGFSIQFRLVFLALYFVICSLFYVGLLFVPLELLKRFSLLFDHVTVSKREVTDPVNIFGLLFDMLPFVFLIFKYFIGLDKGVNLMSLIFMLKKTLLVHLRPMELQ